MQADADLLVRGLEGLSGIDLPSPITDLAALVKGKQVPRKATQMGASINGFLRRGNRTKSEDKSKVDVQRQIEAEVDNITDENSEILLNREPDTANEDLACISNDHEEQPGQPGVTGTKHDPSTTSTVEAEAQARNVIDHFEALQVGLEADQDEIKKAYRRLVMQVRTV
jgi:hypothetical protein